MSNSSGKNQKKKKQGVGERCLLCFQSRKDSSMSGKGTVRIPFCKADAKTTRFKYYHEFPTSERSSKTGNASAKEILAYRRRFLKACGEAALDQIDNHRAFVHRSCLEGRMNHRALLSDWFDEENSTVDSVPLKVFAASHAFVETHSKSGLPLPPHAILSPDGEGTSRESSLEARLKRRQEALLSKVEHGIDSFSENLSPQFRSKNPDLVNMLKEMKTNLKDYCRDRAQLDKDEQMAYEEMRQRNTAQQIEMEKLEKEIQHVRSDNRAKDLEVQNLLHQLLKATAASKGLRFTSEVERHTPTCTRFMTLTGMASPEQLPALYDVISSVVGHQDGRGLGESKERDKYKKSPDPKSLSPKDQLFMTLFLLHTGSSFNLTGALFGRDRSYVGKTFRLWLRYLYRTANLLMPMPTRENIRSMYPPSWVEAFGGKRLRYVLDASNWNLEAPHRGEEQTVTYSSYYSSNCGKYLVITSPSGVILWISPVFAGHITDRNLALYSFIYHAFEQGWLEPGDDLMADRGFNIRDILFSLYCDEIMPPFIARGQSQLSPEQSEIAAKVTHKRVHVERSIGVMKRKWKILGIDMSRQRWDLMTPIVRTCAWLTNELSLPMVGEADRMELEKMMVQRDSQQHGTVIKEGEIEVRAKKKRKKKKVRVYLAGELVVSQDDMELK